MAFPIVLYTSNVQTTTVQLQFLEGVSVYGEPARLRSDHWGENIEV